MNKNTIVLTLLALIVITGCAHPVIVTPDVARLSAPAGATPIPKHVGLYIAPADHAKQVTTPGGGGDKITYHPYADVELGLYKALGNVFQDVTVLKSLSDVGASDKPPLAFIILPDITTSSSSSGVFTWMATDFTMQLTCRVTDSTGHAVTSVSATGTGHAEFSELKSNFSLTGEQASTDALQKIQAALLQAPELRK